LSLKAYFGFLLTMVCCVHVNFIYCCCGTRSELLVFFFFIEPIIIQGLFSHNCKQYRGYYIELHLIFYNEPIIIQGLFSYNCKQYWDRGRWLAAVNGSCGDKLG